MARPNQNTTKKLIDAGKIEMALHGRSGLTLRAVAERAGVNLAMFKYNFQGKDGFVKKVAEEIHRDFLKDLALHVNQAEAPMVRLRKTLRHLAAFCRDQRQILLMLLIDVSNGEKEALRFSRQSLLLHTGLLKELLGKCQKNGGLKLMPLAQMQIIITTSLVGPELVFAFLGLARPHLALGEAADRYLLEEASSDLALEDKVDMLMHLIAAPKRMPPAEIGGRSLGARRAKL